MDIIEEIINDFRYTYEYDYAGGSELYVHSRDVETYLTKQQSKIEALQKEVRQIKLFKEAYLEHWQNSKEENTKLKERVKELEGKLTESVKVLSKIDDELFHHNYSVVGYHLNGEHEPIMNFEADYNMDIINESKQLLTNQ